MATQPRQKTKKLLNGATLHCIASNGKNSINITEWENRLSISIYFNGRLFEEKLSVVIKNKIMNVYAKRRIGIRNITRKTDLIDKFISNAIRSCFKYSHKDADWVITTKPTEEPMGDWDLDIDTSEPAPHMLPYWSRRKGMIRAKVARVNSIIQKFACKKLGVKRINSRKHTIEEVIKYLTYPVSATLPIRLDNNIYGKAKHIADPLKFLDKVVGKKRPKGLNRLLGQAYANQNWGLFSRYLVRYVYHKGLLPIDHIYKTFEFVNFNVEDIHVKKYRKFAKWCGPQFFKFIYEYKQPINEIAIVGRRQYYAHTGPVFSTLTDTIRQYWEMSDTIGPYDKQHNTLRKLHDWLSREYRKYETRDFPLDIAKDALSKLHNINLGSLTIKVPQTSHELIEVGNILGNCVASYAHSIKSKQSLIFTIDRPDGLCYCGEITNQRLSQLSGKYNSLPDPVDAMTVSQYLFGVGLIKENINVVIPEEAIFNGAL